MKTIAKNVTDLAPDETFEYSGTEVTVVGAVLPYEDIFGRPMLKIWCRAGHGEGWMVFGPDATVEVLL